MPPKLLIVEDDNRTCQQLVWGLKDDFDILTAGDRAGALSLAEREGPQVILLDLGLPPTPSDPEEGLRLLQDLRKSTGNGRVPGRVLVYTGHDHQEHALRAMSYGASDVLVKPVDLDALRFIARRACRVAELERELARQRREGEGPRSPSEDLGRPLSIRQARERIEAALTREALARHDGNLTRVADELGISRPTLYAILRKYGLIDRRGS